MGTKEENSVDEERIKETLVNNKQQPRTPLLCPPERPSSPDQPTPESLLSEPSETDLEPPCLEASRFSSQRRSTSACPTCQTSPTRRSPSRLTTLLETGGPHSWSSPPRRKLIPTSSSSPDLLPTRTDTGPCGSSHSSDASLEMRSSRRSLFARRSTLDTESELSDSTEPDRSRPPDSSSESK